MPSYTPIPSTKMLHQARTSQVIYLDAADLMGHPCCSADMCWLMLLPDELLSLSSLSLEPLPPLDSAIAVDGCCWYI